MKQFACSALALALTLSPAALLTAPQAARAQAQLPSPPADASVKLDGKEVAIHYNRPSARGRKIFGGLVPYGKVWRTGANPATDFKTQTDLVIGGKPVPAGHYTLYSLPSEGTWELIVNKQTGQWGTEYNQAQDFVRIPMMKKELGTPQETMSISFENTRGSATELHIKWATLDVFAPVASK